jgi:hypothetical protein
MALALEESETCHQCGLPRAFCRDNENGRARFTVAEEFCWATYAVAQRKSKHDKEKKDPTLQAAYIHAAKIRDGKAPDIMAGLEPVRSEDG